MDKTYWAVETTSEMWREWHFHGSLSEAENFFAIYKQKFDSSLLFSFLHAYEK